MKVKLWAIVLSWLVSGCALPARYIPPLPSPPFQVERTYSAPLEATWMALVDFAALRSLGISHMDKASRIMALSFGANDPASFLDCGFLLASTDGQDFSQRYAEHMVKDYGATLNGKLNVIVRPVATGTLVRVNAIYAFSEPERMSWSFETQTQSTVEYRDGRDPRTCRSSYKAEQQVLDGIAQNLR